MKNANDVTYIEQLDKHPLFDKLCCPLTRQKLLLKDGELKNASDSNSYKISYNGIPLFAERIYSADADRQRIHYDAIAAQYAENLKYPHTEEYMKYLDRVFLEHIVHGDLSEVAEICCGQGELLALAGDKVTAGIGVDISPSMLEIAKVKHADKKGFLFIQADATHLPFCDGGFRCVIMLGGIHHVPDRSLLFSEIYRILRPGGRFYFREPVSDFFLWRWIRAVIYRISPILDSETESPLLWKQTVPPLEQAGFRLTSWRTYGFLGFCIFMNSDVLVFNRLFRFLPGIRTITRWATKLDDVLTKLPGLSRAGLQVVGVAEKPL